MYRIITAKEAKLMAEEPYMSKELFLDIEIAATRGTSGLYNIDLDELWLPYLKKLGYEIKENHFDDYITYNITWIK